MLRIYQVEFRKNRSFPFIDYIFVSKEIQAACCEQKLELHTLFTDIMQAYDRIGKAKMYQVMNMLVVPKKKKTEKTYKNDVKSYGKQSDMQWE